MVLEMKWNEFSRCDLLWQCIHSQSSPRREAKHNIKRRRRNTEGGRNRGSGSEDFAKMLTAAECRVGQCYWHTFDVPSTVCFVWQWSEPRPKSLSLTGAHPVEREDYHPTRHLHIDNLSYFLFTPYIRRHAKAVVDYWKGGGVYISRGEASCKSLLQYQENLIKF